MPEIVSIDLGMRDLVVLDLVDISQLECLIDTTGTGPQVSNLLSKLEELLIGNCKMLRRLFICNPNLCNLKTVVVNKCPLLVNLFSLLTSRNLVLLESLKISHCEGLKNILIDEIENVESREEIDESGKSNKSYVSLFPKLKFLLIEGCHLLESILPIVSSQDLPILEVITIRSCHKLEYIFGQYQHIELNSLKTIILYDLPSFMGLFPNYSHSMSSHVNESSSTSRDGFKAQIQVDPIKCNISLWSCLCCHGNSYRHKLWNMSTTKVPSVHDEDSREKNSPKSVMLSPLLKVYLLLKISSYIKCFKNFLIKLIIYIVDLSSELISEKTISSVSKKWMHKINYREMLYISISIISCVHTFSIILYIWITLQVSSSHNRPQIREHAKCFQVRSLNLCNIKRIKFSEISKIKFVFILSITPKMLLESFMISYCDELTDIVVDIGDDDNGGNNWSKVFPKLKEIIIFSCKKLEYIFRSYTDDNQNHTKIHLPTLQLLDLSNLPSFVATCPKQYSTSFPSLKRLRLRDCPMKVSLFTIHILFNIKCMMLLIHFMDVHVGIEVGKYTLSQ